MLSGYQSISSETDSYNIPELQKTKQNQVILSTKS